MTNKIKVVLCAIIIAVALFIIDCAKPVAHVAANQAIVSQMDNTNSSYITAQTTGNGEGWLIGGVTVVAIGLLYFVITRKR